MINGLDKKEILVFPGNAFVEKLKNFLADESLAALFNIGATWLIRILIMVGFAGYLNRLGISDAWLYALAGPILEKIALWIRPYCQAYKTYQNTPPARRKKYSYYKKRAAQEGLWTFVKDATGHDTLYIAGMIWFQSKYPDTPQEMICAFVFFAAVFLVSIVEYFLMEAWYLGVVWSINGYSWRLIVIEFLLLLNYLQRIFSRSSSASLKKIIDEMYQKLDFRAERYYETRVLFEDVSEARKIFEKLVTHFNLGTKVLNAATENGYRIDSRMMEGNYYDQYFNLKINRDELEGKTPFNNRLLRLRLRERSDDLGIEVKKSLQFVVTRAAQFFKKQTNQIRFYVIKKTKWYCPIDPDNDCLFSSLPSRIDRRFSSHLRDNKVVKMTSRRIAAQNPDNLLVSLDIFEGFCALEIKTYPHNRGFLVEALNIAIADRRYLTSRTKDHLVKMSQQEAEAAETKDI